MNVKFLPEARAELLEGISYIVRVSDIWILAIAHGHTRPEYWIDRPRTIK